MKCPRCKSDIITFGNEWECIKCGYYGSFLDDRDDDEEERKPKIELSDDEKIDLAAAKVLEKLRAAFEELAK